MEIDLAILRKQKLFIATPMYGGMCYGHFNDSMVRLAHFFTKYGLPYITYAMYGESLIPRARNYCVEEFLNSDCTHMIFIDADVGFAPEDVLTLWSLTDDKDMNIVCGAYPKKMISWEKIKSAVDKGIADKDPSVLEKYVGEYVFNPVQVGMQTITMTEPFEIAEGGTGFMCIHRNTFDVYRKKNPDIMYVPDHSRMAGFDGSKEIGLYFDCRIDPITKRYLSEDYYFCKIARKAGMRVWLIPWISLTHTGNFTFGGTMYDLLRIGESLTVDKNKIKVPSSS